MEGLIAGLGVGAGDAQLSQGRGGDLHIGDLNIAPHRVDEGVAGGEAGQVAEGALEPAVAVVPGQVPVGGVGGRLVEGCQENAFVWKPVRLLP